MDWDEWKENSLWTGDKECEKFVTRIVKPGTIAPRALASYPGSGNTWIRYLIEGASGIYTGSTFNNQGQRFNSVLKLGFTDPVLVIIQY